MSSDTPRNMDKPTAYAVLANTVIKLERENAALRKGIAEIINAIENVPGSYGVTLSCINTTAQIQKDLMRLISAEAITAAIEGKHEDNN